MKKLFRQMIRLYKFGYYKRVDDVKRGFKNNEKKKKVLSGLLYDNKLGKLVQGFLNKNMNINN